MTLLSLVLLACADLPEGWAGASPLPLTQSACDGDPYAGDPNERVEAGEDGASVRYLEAHFRCEQDVEAFGLEQDGVLGVLVQPVDMNPRVVARCDCLYNLDIGLQGSTAGEVELWRRWDNLNDPNEPVYVGSVEGL